MAVASATGLGYWLVTSATRCEPCKVRDFTDSMKREVAETARSFEACSPAAAGA